MVPQAPSFSFDYYESLFGSRTPAFWELVAALAEELSSYAGVLSEVEPSSSDAAARLRHDHHPVVVNLRLEAVAQKEGELKQALARGDHEESRRISQALAAEVAAVAQALTSERLRACPKPRPPFPGG